MRFFLFVENYLFKVRYIMNYEPITQGSSRVKARAMSDVVVDDFNKNIDRRLANYLEMRRGSSSWVFFECLESGVRLGYGFLHIPCQTEWNDSLPTRAGEARISNVFVYPAYRGKGIRGEIFSAQAKYSSERGLKLWSVIERANDSSIRAATKTGRIGGKNFLCKFLGRNIFSVLVHPLKVYFLLGVRRARR